MVPESRCRVFWGPSGAVYLSSGVEDFQRESAFVARSDGLEGLSDRF